MDTSELFDEIDSPITEEPAALIPDTDGYTPEQYDEYLGTEVLIPVRDKRLRGIVKKQTHDLNGNLIGVCNGNPILDTRSYHVQMPNGATKVYGANIIAENIMSSVDDEGNLFVLMDKIIDHRKSEEAATESESWYVSRNEVKRCKPTTKGWELLVSWKDGTSSWACLVDIKESFPVEVSEYAEGAKIIHELAFAWWCHKILVQGTKTKYWLKTHKYSV